MSALATATSTDPRSKNDAAVTTKIELVTEAIEALVLTTSVGLSRTLTGDEARQQYDAVMAARSALADSLRLLLQPTLRVTG